MSELVFPPEEGAQLFLSPRAVRSARKAGVLLIHTNTEQIVNIYSNLQQQVPNSMPQTPLDANRLFLVVRWGGARRLSGDIRYTGARPSQQYMPADQYGVIGEEHHLITKAALQAYNRPVVEVTVTDWQEPDFGLRVAQGILGFGQYPKNNLNAAWRLLSQAATVEEGTKVQAAYDCRASYPHPINLLYSQR